MKKLLILGACLVALAAHPSTVLAGDPEIVVVRVYDNGGNIRLVINRPDGKSEKIEFNGGLSEKGLIDSGQGYQKVIATLYKEGYALKIHSIQAKGYTPHSSSSRASHSRAARRARWRHFFIKPKTVSLNDATIVAVTQ